MSWLFPYTCPLCGQISAPVLCPKCAAEHPPELLVPPMLLDVNGRVLYRYAGAARDALDRFATAPAESLRFLGRWSVDLVPAAICFHAVDRDPGEGRDLLVAQPTLLQIADRLEFFCCHKAHLYFTATGRVKS